MCLSTPKTPPPPKLPTQAPEAPKMNDSDVTAARDDTVRRARASSGLASTVRADTGGLNAAALYPGTKQLLGQ